MAACRIWVSTCMPLEKKVARVFVSADSSLLFPILRLRVRSICTTVELWETVRYLVDRQASLPENFHLTGVYEV